MEVTVTAVWDEEARVWVAESEHVPGLVTEANTVEALMAKLRVLIPELLEANGVLPPNQTNVPYSLIARDRAELRAA